MSTESKVIHLTDAISSEEAIARDTQYYESRMAPLREGALVTALEELRDDTVTLAMLAELRNQHPVYIDHMVDEYLINQRSVDKFKARIATAYETYFQ